MSNNFGEIVDKAKEMTDVGVKKAGELLEMTKKNIKLGETTGNIDRTYKEIGKLYYEAVCLGADNAAEIESKVEVVKALKESEKLLNTEIANLKGKKICPNCGACNKEDNSFCGACGARI